MPTYNESITESGSAADSHYPGFNEGLTESASAADALPQLAWTTSLGSDVLAQSSLIGVSSVTLVSTADASSAVTGNPTHRLASAAVAADAVVITSSTDGALATSVLAQSAVELTIVATAASAGAATSSVSQRFYATVVEVAAVTESTVLNGTAIAVIADTVEAVSALSFGKSETVASSVEATSSTSLTATAQLASEASASSAVTPVATVVFELESEVAATSAMTPRAERRLSLSASAVVSSSLRLPIAARQALWTNTRTTAAAYWTHLKVNSVVEQDGVLYGAAVDGVHELTNDGSHTGSVTWDLMDFGSPQLKTLGSAYVDGTSQGPFTVRVANRQGTYDYSTHLLLGSEHTQNHRADLGKGLKSEHYRFTVLENTHFDVGEVRVQIAEAARRRG